MTKKSENALETTKRSLPYLIIAAVLLTVPLSLAADTGAPSENPMNDGSEQALSGVATPPTAGAFHGEFSEIVGNAQRAMILLERAENVLIRECMAPFGFEFHGPTSTEVEPYFNEELVDVLQPGVAEQHGYGSYIRADPAEAADARASFEAGSQYFASLNAGEKARFVEALHGSGDAGAIQTASGLSIGVNGCIGEARSELLGDQLVTVFETFNALQFSQPDVWGSDEVLETLTLWNSCMEAAGYSFRTPNDAVAWGLQSRNDEPRPSQAEIDLAVADSKCRSTSGLIETVRGVTTRLHTEAVTSKAPLIEDWVGLEVLVLDRASAVFGHELAADE